jgi:hypothetical protein
MLCVLKEVEDADSPRYNGQHYRKQESACDPYALYGCA